MKQAKVLIVDDEPNILLSLKRALEVEGYQVLTADSGPVCLDLFVKNGSDLIMLDVVMPKMDGLQVLDKLQNLQPELPIVMMSGNATIETAVKATKLGAFDFIEKPLSTEKILITISNALKINQLRKENEELRQLTQVPYEMIGGSAAIKKIFDTIRKTAPSQGRVLISGPNGTGKELVARALHRHSKRAPNPFVKVNCAAIPQELIESELFGHEKGAFTGATTLRKGKFELAHTGTLFLDEIADMSLKAQAKVLRALQEGEIERVGGTGSICVDVRIIAATNKNLTDEIFQGRFREDLFYRLNVVPIEVPALRNRREDIPDLVKHFVKLCSKANDKREMKITQEAVSLLIQHDWPGNVRELKNSIERLVILANSNTIEESDVQECLPVIKRPPKSYQKGVSLKDMLATVERDIIIKALKSNKGRVAPTAMDLKIERSHLYKKMRAFGIVHQTPASEE